MTTIHHGDVLRVPARGHPIPVLHYGIAARNPWGEITVLSNSKRRRGVVEEPLAEFADGEAVTVVPVSRRHSRDVTVARARSRLGQGYDAVVDNCEHFVRGAVGAAAISLQVIFWGGLLTAGVAGDLYYLLGDSKPARRRRLRRY
jgi:hypothetical protein